MIPLSILITQEARSWIGTPFHHQGRLKKSGCDCLGLVLGVAKALHLHSRTTRQLLHHLDVRDYERRPDGSRLKETLAEHLWNVAKEEAEQGDIALFLFDGQPQHVGILGEYPAESSLSIIHAYAPARKVIEHRMDALWQNRMIATFRIRR